MQCHTNLSVNPKDEYRQKYKDMICDRLNTGRDFVLFRFPNQNEWHIDTDPEWTVKTSLYDKYERKLPDATATDHYLDSVARLRDEHKRRGGKTVYSRVIRGCIDAETSIVDAAEAYFEVNPHAFVPWCRAKMSGYG